MSASKALIDLVVTKSVVRRIAKTPFHGRDSRVATQALSPAAARRSQYV